MTASLLTAEQAGELLNVPPSWVLAQARSNRIPHVKLGRYVRFEAAALEDWWRRRLQGPVRSAYPGGEPIQAGRRRPNAPAHDPQERALP
jgi:excisionase family DNA binding protein